MKKPDTGRWTLAALVFLAASFIFVSCNEDVIVEVNDTTGGSTPVDIDDINDNDTNFDRTVTVVFSTSANATVNGGGDSIEATINGNDVIIKNFGTEKVRYNISGTTTDGYLKIYSGRKQTLSLDGANIKNTRGAAINVQGYETTPAKGKRVDLLLNGTNTLADGSAYTLTPSTEDEKAVLFSEGQIVVSGSGSLTVTASGKAGITSDDWVAFTGGVNVGITSSAGHGVRGKDYVLVNSGTLNINVSADGKKGISSDSLVRFDGGETTIAISGNTVVESSDTNRVSGIKADYVFEMNDGTLTITNSGKGGKGISCDGPAYFRGGSVDITVTGANFGSSSGGGGGHGPGGWGGNSSDNSVGAKGIKCDGNIEISGGVIKVVASNHEGIETKGTLTITGGEVYSQSSDDAINSASDMTISGGYVCAYSTGNDGLDANGNLYIDGGVVFAICTGSNNAEVSIDANTEGGKKLYVRGGTILTCGDLESGSQLTQSCYQVSSWTKNVWYSVTVGNKTYAFHTPSSGGTKMVVSGAQQPTVKSSVSITGGTEMCNGMLNEDPTVSGGNNVSLSNYSSSGGGWW